MVTGEFHRQVRRGDAHGLAIGVLRQRSLQLGSFIIMGQTRSIQAAAPPS